MTHLSVKALRLYHELGLLAPAAVDRQSGYRYYEADQVPIAQVIRRFRDLEMPVEHLKAVLAAPDIATRNALVVEHLRTSRQRDRKAYGCFPFSEPTESKLGGINTSATRSGRV